MNTNYENLSYEELQKLLKAKDNEIERLNTENENYKKKTDTLENEYEILKVNFRRKQEELNKLLSKIEELENKCDILNTGALNERKKQFASKSEKLPKTLVVNSEEALAAKDKLKRSNRGRKPGVKNINNTIPTEGLREIICDFSEEELAELRKTHELVEFDSYTVIKLIKKPAEYEWVKVIHHRYKDKKTKEIISPENNDPFKKSVVTSSFVAEVIANKTVLGLPMERQSKWYKSNGLDMSTSSIAHYMMRGAEILEPIYQRMFHHLINNSARVIHCDETPVKVLDNIKEYGRKTSYMFVLTTSFWDYPVFIYDFSMQRTTDNIETYLKDYQGYLTVDGFTGYDKFKKNSKSDKAGDFHLNGVSMCYCHLRRYWTDAEPEMFSKNGSEGPARKMVHLIDVIFNFEEQFKKASYTMNQIKEARNKIDYLTALNNIKSYAASLTAVKGSQLDKAINYTLSNWTELTEHLNYGGLDITNQIAERSVRPFSVARSSFLFCKSNKGATASGRLFSVAQTAKANGLNVEKYLEYVFEHISTKTAEDLLPWSKELPEYLYVKL